MKVLRIECTTCTARGKTHGPHVTCYYNNNVNRYRPLFGSLIPPPEMDGLEDISINEFCGVLPEQYAGCWSKSVWDWNEGENKPYTPEIPDGWRLACYEVAEDDVRIGWHQVVFRHRKASVVWTTTDPFDERIYNV